MKPKGNGSKRVCTSVNIVYSHLMSNKPGYLKAVILYWLKLLNVRDFLAHLSITKGKLKLMTRGGRKCN